MLFAVLTGRQPGFFLEFADEIGCIQIAHLFDDFLQRSACRHKRRMTSSIRLFQIYCEKLIPVFSLKSRLK